MTTTTNTSPLYYIGDDDATNHLVITPFGPMWADQKLPIQLYTWEEVEELQKVMRFPSSLITESVDVAE